MSVVSGLVGASSAENAAEEQAAAARYAADVQKDMYDTTRQDMMPWIEAGRNALGTLQGGPVYGPSRTEQRIVGYKQGSKYAIRPGTANTPMEQYLVPQSDYMRALGSPNNATTLMPMEAPGEGNGIPEGHVALTADQLAQFGLSSGGGEPIYETVTVPGDVIGNRKGLLTEGPGEEETGYKTRLNALLAGPGEFTESEGYEFRRGEGEKSIERSAAAKGSPLSGATLKALSRFNQDYASNERSKWLGEYYTDLASKESSYDSFLNRYYKSLDPWFNLAGMGQTTAGQLGNIGTATASNVGQSAQDAGNAIASGYINQANALTGASNRALSTYTMGKGAGWWGNNTQNALAWDSAASTYGAGSNAEWFA